MAMSPRYEGKPREMHWLDAGAWAAPKRCPGPAAGRYLQLRCRVQEMLAVRFGWAERLA